MRRYFGTRLQSMSMGWTKCPRDQNNHTKCSMVKMGWYPEDNSSLFLRIERKITGNTTTFNDTISPSLNP